ncbi:MAG: O-antigen ligase family protein [Firmicutes bacterium]|nr:O-antigen ligase family protein [Bacillota bacterium]
MRERAVYKEKISIDCIAVCVYLMCLPLTTVTTPFGSALKIVTFPVLAVLFIRTIMGKNKLTLNYIHFIYAVFTLYSFTGLLFLHDDRAVTQTTDMLLTFIAMLFITMRVYNSSEREMMDNAWLIAGLFCIFVAMTSTETTVGDRIVIRIFGCEEDQNQFCAYLIMPVLISLKRFIDKRKFYPIYILIILLSFYSVLRTGSRGGLLGIAAGVVIYIFIGLKSVKSRVILCLLLLFVVIGVVFFVFPLLPEDIQERYTVSSVVDDRGAGRLEIWLNLLQFDFADTGQLVHGAGMFSTYDILATSTVDLPVGVAHNTFIQILTDHGMIGLMIFMFLIFGCVIRQWKNHPVYTCAYVAVMAFSMSLSLHVFKPYINIIMMCAMTFEGETVQDKLDMQYQASALDAGVK